MSYCNAREQVTVNYDFANNSDAYITSDIVSNIQVDPISYQTIAGNLYYVTFPGNRWNCYAPITQAGYNFFSDGPYGSFAVQIKCRGILESESGLTNLKWHSTGGGGNILSGVPENYWFAGAHYPMPFQVYNLNNSPVPGRDFTIKIFSGNTLLFEDRGVGPCTFTVTCGRNRCPQGFVECSCSTPPGYCCIPCQSTAQRINNLTNRL